MDWITITKAAEKCGYTEKAIRDKIADGTWRMGAVWRKARDGRILISQKGYDAWVEERECAPPAAHQSA